MVDINHLTPLKLDLTASRTLSVENRKNLLTIDNLEEPDNVQRTIDRIDINNNEVNILSQANLDNKQTKNWDEAEFAELIERIKTARQHGAPVICFMGAHLIKCGLSRYIIELIKRGFITHIAGNGAVSIHDFELAFLGGTSEYVPDAIENGTFGMWEETGSMMNQAVNEGYRKGLGYGVSLAYYIDRNPELFPHKGDCIFYQAYSSGIPASFHISIGTDIIHQHPSADFASLGGASGIDFSIFCYSVSQLENGVFLNFGSAVTGPEVFLKALSISRNQGYIVKKITTANFDIIPLADYRKEISKDDYLYFYRPRKNIINRPTSLGGKGFYIQGNHKITIPQLYRELTSHR